MVGYFQSPDRHAVLTGLSGDGFQAKTTHRRIVNEPHLDDQQKASSVGQMQELAKQVRLPEESRNKGVIQAKIHPLNSETVVCKMTQSAPN